MVRELRYLSSVVVNCHNTACFTIFASLGHIYSLTVLTTVMLLKVMSRSDPSSFRIDGDGGSEPVTLTPVGDIQFGLTSDAEAGKTQMSSDKVFLHAPVCYILTDYKYSGRVKALATRCILTLRLWRKLVSAQFNLIPALGLKRC